MPRVLISDKLEAAGLNLLRQSGIELDERAGLNGDALDMRVVGFDPFPPPDRAAQLGIEAVAALNALLPLCDFLPVHTPLTPETTNLVGAEQIAKMKKGARLINCARGGIINEEALADGL